MNEARVENNLAKRVVENPNELSGARPAQPDAPVANTNTSTTNVKAAPSNANAAAPANSAPANATPANANRPAAKASNTNANR